MTEQQPKNALPKNITALNGHDIPQRCRRPGTKTEGDHMLNVGKIEEGFVLDHIKAGKSLDIYEHLQLDKLDCTVAIIKNARSGKMGKKDILKVECDINTLDLDILAYIDHNITVNVIKNGVIEEKKVLVLPKEIKNVIKCHNPRCITSIEQELPHIFCLADAEKEIYRCKYCEQKYTESAK